MRSVLTFPLIDPPFGIITLWMLNRRKSAVQRSGGRCTGDRSVLEHTSVLYVVYDQLGVL